MSTTLKVGWSAAILSAIVAAVLLLRWLEPAHWSDVIIILAATYPAWVGAALVGGVTAGCVAYVVGRIAERRSGPLSER